MWTKSRVLLVRTQRLPLQLSLAIYIYMSTIASAWFSIIATCEVDQRQSNSISKVKNAKPAF